MAFSFPTSPTLNQEYTFGGKTWRYNGTGWALVTGVDAAQSAWSTANLAYINSNSATVLAQGAYDTANSKFDKVGGTITGNVFITRDLSVSGNLSVLGNTFSVNAGSIVTNDTLLIMGKGNYVSDVLDIGFVSHYNDGTNAHSGLIRDVGTKEWHLFKDYTPEISANNNIDINDPSFVIDTLNANLHSTTVTIKGIDILPYANGIYNTANAAFASANNIDGVNLTQNNSIVVALNTANAAFLAANAATATDTTQNNSITAAFDTANAAFASANNIDGVNLTQNNSITVALNTGNSAFIHANAVFANANSYITYNEAVSVTQNNSIAAAFAAANAATATDATQNNSITVALDTANAAYANANSYITYNEAVNVTQNNSIAAAFAAANAATATDTTQNNSITASFNTANAAFVRANNSLDANTGGTVTGDVTIVGNVTSNSLTTTGSNGSITGANAIFTNYVFAANGAVDLYIHTSRAYDKANAAFTSANNTDGVNTTQNNSIIVALDTANAAYIRANNSLDANNGGSVSGTILSTANVRADYVVANTGFASAAGASRLQLTDIGLAAIQVAGEEFKFGASGIESSPGIFGGSFGGNKLTLSNETNLISNRYDIVKIQTGTDGTTPNEFVFSNNSLTVPGGITANGFTAGGINVVPTLSTSYNTANAAFAAANAATATDTTQNNSITAAFLRANNSLDANNGGTIAGDIIITGNLSCNIVGGTF